LLDGSALGGCPRRRPLGRRADRSGSTASVSHLFDIVVVIPTPIEGFRAEDGTVDGGAELLGEEGQ
jgi:hypothetical protein